MNPMTLPTTPLFSPASIPTLSVTYLPTTVSTMLPSPVVPSSPGPNGATMSLTSPITALGDPPSDLIQTAGTTLHPPGMMIATTTLGGIFGVGAKLDPLVIFGLVVGGLILLVLIGALIYCCCVCCGCGCHYVCCDCCACCDRPARQDFMAIRRTPPLRSVIAEPPPPQPLFLRASIGPDCPTCGAEPAASVLLDQPIRVNIGAYAVGDGTSGTLMTKRVMGSYPQRVQTVRKKYLYPADSIGYANNLTYNAARPTIVTTLGDGYAQGHSLRSTGNPYGNRRFVLLDDSSSNIFSSSSPQFIAID